MKYVLILSLLIGGCTSPQKNFEAYGEKLSPDDAITTSELLEVISEAPTSYKVQGVIEEVCQMKGCWMTLKNDQGANIRVTFKDYGFFVPKDISGREVIVDGVATKEMIDEDMARHYAEDEGKTYDESMRETITFVAKGVLVKKG